MKRALIVTLISGALALSTALPIPVFAGEAAPVPDSAADSTPCTLRDGPSLAIGDGCCQRQGGLCRCRDGRPTCCDGLPGAGCSCRGDSSVPEAVSTAVPS